MSAFKGSTLKGKIGDFSLFFFLLHCFIFLVIIIIIYLFIIFAAGFLGLIEKDVVELREDFPSSIPLVTLKRKGAAPSTKTFRPAQQIRIREPTPTPSPLPHFKVQWPNHQKVKAKRLLLPLLVEPSSTTILIIEPFVIEPGPTDTMMSPLVVWIPNLHPIFPPLLNSHGDKGYGGNGLWAA